MSFQANYRSLIVVQMEDLNFAQQLQVFAKKKGWRQRQMAEALDVSIRFYQKLESGESEPSLKTLQQTLKGLDVSYNEFFGINGEKEITEHLRSVGVLLSQLGSLSPIRRAAILHLIYKDDSLLDGLDNKTVRDVRSLSKNL